MHLQENLLYNLWPGDKVTQYIAQFPLHHVTYAGRKFEVATSSGLGGDTFTTKYILHHVTYAYTKLDIGTFNS